MLSNNYKRNGFYIRLVNFSVKNKNTIYSGCHVNTLGSKMKTSWVSFDMIRVFIHCFCNRIFGDESIRLNKWNGGEIFK